MQIDGSDERRPASKAELLALRVRSHLCQIAGKGTPITYQSLATDLGLSPPNTIRQLTAALEHLMQEDVAAGRPLISALVVSKSRDGMPATGFFDHAHNLGRFSGDPLGPDGLAYYSVEFAEATEYWSSATDPS